MMKMSVVALAVAISLVASAFADNAALIPDQFAAGWSRSEAMLRFVKNDLYGHIDGGAELFHELGFDELLVQRYTKGEQELSLEIYVMSSTESALGIYLTKCGKEKPNPAVKTRHTANRTQFTLLRCNYFIQINNTYGDSAVVPDMITLANAVIEKIPEGKPVTLFGVLPKEDMVTGSELLVRGQYGLQPIFTFGPGDILMLNGEVFAAVADYANSAGVTWTRVMIDYPDTARAKAAFDNLVAKLDSTLVVQSRSTNRFSFKDYQSKYGSAVLNGKILDIHLHLPRDPTAPKSK
jgi:hypothetical protein